MKTTKQIWKDIEGFEGFYQVSNYGRIKSITRIIQRSTSKQFFKEQIRKTWIDKGGYIKVFLFKNNIRYAPLVHRLVGKAFVPGYKKGLEINHKKGNKKDNRAWMLEWVTRSQNLSHKFKVLGVENKGGLKRIKVKQYSLKGKLLGSYNSLSEASRKTKIDVSQICACVNKKHKYKTAGGYIWK